MSHRILCIVSSHRLVAPFASFVPALSIASIADGGYTLARCCHCHRSTTAAAWLPRANSCSPPCHIPCSGAELPAHRGVFCLWTMLQDDGPNHLGMWVLSGQGPRSRALCHPPVPAGDRVHRLHRMECTVQTEWNARAVRRMNARACAHAEHSAQCTAVYLRLFVPSMLWRLDSCALQLPYRNCLTASLQQLPCIRNSTVAARGAPCCSGWRRRTAARRRPGQERAATRSSSRAGRPRPVRAAPLPSPRRAAAAASRHRPRRRRRRARSHGQRSGRRRRWSCATTPGRCRTVRDDCNPVLSTYISSRWCSTKEMTQSCLTLPTCFLFG